MFYKIDNLPTDEMNKDFFLISNFLEQCPITVKKIADELDMMTLDVTEKMYFNIYKITETTFEFLAPAKRHLKIEIITNPKELYKKITENGLSGESLYAKLNVLDWLWEKAQKVFIELMGGVYDNLLITLINQLNSILKSILNALGFPTDIFDEALDLLMSFVVLCNTNIQEK